MNFVLTCCAIAVFLSFLYSRGKNEYGLIAGFVLVTVIQAIRFEYGADMPSYAEDYDRIVSYGFSFRDVFVNKIVYKEPGWALLCFIFKPLGGFYIMTAAISIFENIVIYRFIKQNVERENQFFGAFIYLFTFSFYLLNMSMIRQGLAIAVGLLIYEFLKKDKIVVAVLLAIAASFVHTSAIILLFLVAAKYIAKAKQTIVVGGILFIFLALWIFSSMVYDISSYLIVFLDLEQYEFYTDKILGHMGIGFLVQNIPFFVILYTLLTYPLEEDVRTIFIISALGYMLQPFSYQVNMVNRMLLYLTAFDIASIPILTRRIKTGVIKYIVIVAYVGFMLIGTYATIQADSFYLPYKEYQTIFSNWNNAFNL